VPAVTAPPPIVVTLYLRPECHLCEDMKAALQQVAARVPLTLREIDISTDAALTARYGEDIPVVEAGGSEIARHRATAAELLDRLTRQMQA
jgi:thiol-disulfide isomerase/thioredoxin